MKKVMLFLILGACFVLPSMSQSTWNNSSIESRTGGTLSVGTLNQDPNRTISLVTNGTTVNPTVLKYGIYNRVSATGNGSQYGAYHLVGNGTATGQKFGVYAQILGSRATGIYSYVSCNEPDCFAGYFKGKLLVNATTAPDVDALGVWSSIQSYSFLVKRDGRTFVNTLRLGESINVNDLNGTLRYTTANGFEGYTNGSWGPIGGVFNSVWDEIGSDIAYDGGNVYIGTTPGQVSNSDNYKLLVDGKIIAEEVRVQLSGNWPDYVFDEKYERLDWKELANFIDTEKHLPGVPSESEVRAAGGVDVGEMDRVLLEKIEELTLYMLDLKSENEELKKRIQSLENTAKK